MLSRYLLKAWPRAAWYAGKYFPDVKINGCSFQMPSRFMTGTLRLGAYEAAEMAAIRRFLPADKPVIELGCGLGVISCLTNKRLAHPQQHVCIDANAQALQHTRMHGRMNGCQFETRLGALAYDTTTVRFECDPGVLAGRVGNAAGSVDVPAVTLAGLFEQTAFAAATLICDIEGAEAALLQREGALLTARVPCLILETHPTVYGRAGEAEVFRQLEARGFRQQWHRDDVSVWVQ